jgi:hypothetical protein
LLLSQDADDKFILIEFKRPSHPITRDDIAQAEKYRDDLSRDLPGGIQIIMIGKGRVATLDMSRLASGISVESYLSLIASARNELNWLINQLKP